MSDLAQAVAGGVTPVLLGRLCALALVACVVHVIWSAIRDVRAARAARRLEWLRRQAWNLGVNVHLDDTEERIRERVALAMRLPMNRGTLDGDDPPAWMTRAEWETARKQKREQACSSRKIH